MRVRDGRKRWRRSSKVATAGNTPMLSSCKVYSIMMYADLISVILAIHLCTFA